MWDPLGISHGRRRRPDRDRFARARAEPYNYTSELHIPAPPKGWDTLVELGGPGTGSEFSSEGQFKDLVFRLSALGSQMPAKPFLNRVDSSSML